MAGWEHTILHQLGELRVPVVGVVHGDTLEHTLC